MAKKDKDDKGHKTKAFQKAKDKKEDSKFVELLHEKKFGDRPKLKKTAQSTVTGYSAAEQKKLNKEIGQTYNPYNPKSKKNPGGYTGKYYKGSVDKRQKSKTGGRVGLADGGRTNLLEELGRVEAKPSNANRRAEISRVHGELNKGYNKGGRVGFKHGSARPKGGWTS